MDKGEWADALGCFWAGRLRGGYPILMLEDSSFLDVARVFGTTFDSADAARDDFLAVARPYLSRNNRPWEPVPISDSVGPFFLIQIAVQVYAACLMADAPDGKYTQNAYYIQLGRVLDRCPRGNNWSQELGVDQKVLWDTRLQEWLGQHNLELQLPQDRPENRKHVILPQSQIGLKLGDLQKLPRFFREHSIRPHGTDREQSLKRALTQLPSYFSSAARRAWKNAETKAIIESQIRQCLELWDGAWEVEASANGRAMHGADGKTWWLSIREARREIVFLRGAELNDARFVDSDEFDEALADVGASAKSTTIKGRTLRFRRDADDLVWTEVDLFEPGDQGMIALCRNQLGLEEDVRRLISNPRANVASDAQVFDNRIVKDGERKAMRLQGLPRLTLLIKFHIAETLPNLEEVDEAWYGLLRTPEPKLVPTGGLRFGNKHHWIVGAGPGIRVVGQGQPCCIRLDGQKIPAADYVQERILRHPVLSELGEHEVTMSIDGFRCDCTVRVSLPESGDIAEQSHRSWVFSDGWPVWADVEVSGGELLSQPSVFGMQACGFPDDAPASRHDNDRRHAIRMLAGVPTSESIGASEMNHPLVKLLSSRLTIESRNCGH